MASARVDLAGPSRQVLADRRLQVVDVVEEHLLDFAGRRFHVAGHGDVDDEERPVAPLTTSSPRRVPWSESAPRRPWP